MGWFRQLEGRATSGRPVLAMLAASVLLHHQQLLERLLGKTSEWRVPRRVQEPARFCGR